MELTSWAFAMARARLEDALPRRWAHVQGVAKRARTATVFLGADGDLLVSAAVLHDIGYAPDLVDTGFHAIDGGRYLRRVEAPERIVNLVAHHSCAVVEAELRGLSKELAEFTDERTALRDALWWADLTTTPDGEPTTLDLRAQEITARYGPDHVVPRFIRQAWPQLVEAVERTETRIGGATG